MVRRRRSTTIARVLGLVSLLTSCVNGPGPFFDKRTGLADPYFSGQFSYEGAGNVAKHVKLTLKGKAFSFEDDGELTGFVTLHPYRKDLWIAQLERKTVPEGRKPFLYLLVRKTSSGFEVGGTCSNMQNFCEMNSRSDVLSELAKQVNVLSADPSKWVSVRRDGEAPQGLVAQSQNPSEDCNSSDTKRKLAGCTALIENGVLRDADLALAFSLRSDAYVALRDFDHAVADRKRAAQLQPNDLSYQMRLSGGYQLRAAARGSPQSEAAIDDLSQAIQVDPTNYDAKLQRSAILASVHKLPRAIEDAEDALKADAANAATSKWLSALLEQRVAELWTSSDFGGIVSVLSRSIQLDPKNPELFLQRGNAYSMKGDYGRAIADYSDAIFLRANYTEALLLRAEMYSRTGQLERSLSDANAAVKSDGKNVYALLARALARESTGDFELARQDYAKALGLDSKLSIAKAGLERAKLGQEAGSKLELLTRERSGLTHDSPTTNTALSPSFNCAKASNSDETAICNDRTLAFLDRELNAAFRLKQAGLSQADSRLLQQEQGMWLKLRRQCQSDAECIANSYRSRILELQNWNPSTLQME